MASADPGRPSVASPWDEKQFYIFGGIDLGMASYSASALSTDVSRTGVVLGARALASYYAKNWLVDGGLGFN